jgi:hypothetical protein
MLSKIKTKGENTVRKSEKEKLVNRMVRVLWNKNGGASAHGYSFHDADATDDFGYRETAEMIINATLRSERKTNKKGEN